jgi:NAD(P)-dependent dehydrogenase (short-subunit alcohol dehydrogenase family)
MSVSSKIGIVTGAGSGLGEASAKRVAREGAKLVVADRDKDAAERVAEQIEAAGGPAAAFAADVSVFAEVQALADFAVATFGGLDIALNNAGSPPSSSTPARSTSRTG